MPGIKSFSLDPTRMPSILKFLFLEKEIKTKYNHKSDKNTALLIFCRSFLEVLGWGSITQILIVKLLILKIPILPTPIPPIDKKRY